MYCLSHFCCVCLCNKTGLVNLNKLDEDNIPIINKLIFIAYGHERLDLEITKLICDTCLHDLRIAYKFKTTCLISSEIILGYSSQLKYFTGSAGDNCDLNVKFSEEERLNTDKKSLECVQDMTKTERKYKPRPLSKQKKYFKDELKHPNHFKCKFCNESFEKPILRLIHHNKRHAKMKTVKLSKKQRFLQKPPISRQFVSTSENLSCICSMCQKSFQTAKLLKYHLFKTHFNDSNRLCRHCNQYFNNRKSFLNHLKNKHNYNNFTCQICNAKYLKELNFNKHMGLHAENKISKKSRKKPQDENKKLNMITRYLVCNVCDEIFINAEQLQTHLLKHDTSNTETNDKISENSETSDNISDPMEIKLEPIVEIKEEFSNNEETGLQDPLHNFNFNIESVVSISNKEENIHQNESIVSISNKEENIHQNEVENMKIDVSEENPEQNKYSCNICNKQFNVKSFLAAHLLIHNGVASTFDCTHCNVKFNSNSDLAQHLTSKTCLEVKNASFFCDICFKSFKFEFSLNQHKRTH